MKVFINCEMRRIKNFNNIKSIYTKSLFLQNQSFYKYQERTFFLKFMIQKNWIPDPKKNIPKKVESVDIKSLLDEKNVKISLSDILTDYKYFKNEYYYIKYKKAEDKPNFPFDNKNINFKSVFEYFFIKVYDC
jgi:hypothetical protein